jgi:hypothetical protein
MSSDSSVGFKILYHQGEKLICPFSYSYYRNLQKKIRTFSVTGFATIVAVAVISSLITNLLFGGKLPGQAADYGWRQTTWSGGASTTARAMHVLDSNIRNGWGNYFSKESGINFIGASSSKIQLAVLTGSTTQTTVAQFAAGATSSVEVLGAGDGYVRLERTELANVWSTMAPLPIKSMLGAMVYTKDGYVYANDSFDGVSINKRFWRYNIATNAWEVRADMPGNSYGGAMVYDGKGNIYANQARSDTSVYTDAFWKYNIASNTWDVLPVMPGISFNGAMYYDTSTDEIYAIQGNATAGFWKYYVSSSSWEVLPGLPAATNDAAMVYDNNGHLFWTKGGGSNPSPLYKYDLATETWTTATNTPLAVNGNSIASDNLGYLYINKGYNTLDFWKYNISANTWASLSPVPLSSSGGAMAYDDAGSIYMTQGSNNGGMAQSTIFWKYNVYDLYSSSGNFTSSGVDFGVKTVVDSINLKWGQVANGGSIGMLIATSSNGTVWSSFKGSDGTNQSDCSAGKCYSTSTGQLLNSANNGTRYVKYKAFLSSANKMYTPNLNDVTFEYQYYATTSSIISSWYNTTQPGNVVANIKWKEDAVLATGTQVKFQLRTAVTDNPDLEDTAEFPATTSPWIGPDNTSNSYFTNSAADCTKDGAGYVSCQISHAATSTIGDGVDDQWLQYKVTLVSAGDYTPTVEEVEVKYVVNDAPDFQNIVATQSTTTGMVNISFDVRDLDTDSGGNPGEVYMTLQYCTTDCSVGSSNWTDASSTLVNADGSGPLGTTTVKSNQNSTSSDYTTHSLVWDAKADYPEAYNANFRVRLKANDHQLANNLGYGVLTASTVLDTKKPIINSITINASTQIGSQPATLYLDIFEDGGASNTQFKYSADENFNGSNWQTMTGATQTVTYLLPSPTSTIFFQFMDNYGNISSGSTAPPPAPEGIAISDITTADPIYQEFISWKRVYDASFAKYVIWRATSTEIYLDENGWQNLDFTRHSEIASSSVNYFMDTPLENSSTTFYYKVTMEDTLGNVSRYLNIIHDNPDGQSQDATAPTISGVQVIATTTQTAVIEWETNELADSLVMYLTAEEYQSNASSSIDLFTGALSAGIYTYANFATGSNAIGAHRVTLNRLEPDTDYYFKVLSKDPSGNQESQSGDSFIFHTQVGPKIVMVRSANIPTTNTTAEIYWKTNVPADSLVVYATQYNNLGDLLDPIETRGSMSSSTEHNITLSDLEPNTPYYFYVVSADAQGNRADDKNVVGGEPVYFSFTTTNDQVAPTMQGSPFCQPVVTDSTGKPGLVITSRTSEPAIFNLDYGTSSGVWDGQLATTTDFDFNQTARLDNVSASTTYFFQFNLFDASDNATTTEIYSCNTLVPMVASSVAEDLVAQLVGKVPEDEVGQRIASSVAVMIDETVPNDPNDATSTLWVQLARQGWMSITKATAWVLASSTEALFGMVREETITARIASTSDELKLDNNATSTDATSTLWVKRAREAWIPEAQKEQHSGTTFTQADLDAAKQAGKSEAQASSGGGGMIIIDKTDKVAPVITDIKVSGLTATSAKVSWRTDEPASGFVKYGLDSSYGEYAGFADLFKEHYFTLKNLEPKARYHFNIQSTDASGNIATSKDAIFDTLELTAEEIAIIASTTQAEAAANKETLMNDVVNRAIEVLKNVAGQVSLGALQNSLLSQYDAIDQLARIIPGPVLSGEPVIESTPTTAVISWHTDQPANSMVAYAPAVLYSQSKGRASYVQLTGEPNKLVTEHSVKIIGLKPETVYHYQLRSKAKIGPESSSRDFTFKTRPEALEIISYTTDTVSSESATFKWLTSAVTDSEIKVIPYHGSNLAIDEAKTVTDKNITTNHEITYREFAAGTVYQITLSGKDAKGTRIEKVISSFSTTRDDLPPEIADIQTESALSQSKEAKVQTIITWTTNEPTISQVKFAKGVLENEADLRESEPIETVYSRKHTIVITKFEVGEVYSFRILAVDSGGNQTISSAHIILTPKQKEGVFELIIRTFESTFGWLGQMRN